MSSQAIEFERSMTHHHPVFAEEETVLRSNFVSAMRQVPGAVAIVATDLQGERGGLAVTAWCSLSADPPTVLVCVNKSASAHDLILSARKFSINQLGADDT